jgi:hypothetical protein
MTGRENSLFCLQEKQEVVRQGLWSFHGIYLMGCQRGIHLKTVHRCVGGVLPSLHCPGGHLDQHQPKWIDKLTHPNLSIHTLTPCGPSHPTPTPSLWPFEGELLGRVLPQSPGVVAARMSHLTNIVCSPQGAVVGGSICRIHSALIDCLEHVTHQRGKAS